jgi:hypothetical protein
LVCIEELVLGFLYLAFYKRNLSSTIWIDLFFHLMVVFTLFAVLNTNSSFLVCSWVLKLQNSIFGIVSCMSWSTTGVNILRC